MACRGLRRLVLCFVERRYFSETQLEGWQANDGKGRLPQLGKTLSRVVILRTSVSAYSYSL